MERKLTPKEERSRDNWREKGRLAEIQTLNGFSREELAHYFQQQAEEKLKPTDPVSEIVYNSADVVLAYLTPPRRKKKS